MSEKFQNKYRISSSRLLGWDYSRDGWYFITICVKYFEKIFGEIKDDRMVLNFFGLAAKKCWLEIPEHFPFVVLDDFVIMPKHIHGILGFNKNGSGVETQNFASLRRDNQNRFGPQSKNLASVIRGFKIGVKKFSIKNNIKFSWQPRFYDRIIRDEQSLRRVREYIKNNPVKWSRDRNILKNF